jgi:probable rRNA maturation factor
VNVFLADEQSVSVDAEALVGLAGLVLQKEGFPDATDVTVVLVDEEVMAGYHESHLGKPGPTDVLSFPLEHLRPGRPPAAPGQGAPPIHLGDVLIAPSYVARQATGHGVGFGDEMALMLVHGMLHLLGYDHESEADAEGMERRERELLAEVGVQRR